MAKKNEYLIGFSGLKEGHHFFEFNIGDKFFEQLDYSEIKKANLKVKVDFEKKETMMVVGLDIEGTVDVMCDRCTDDFSIPVNGKDEVIYKFTETEEFGDKVKCVLPHEVEIDLSHPIYEIICLLLPTRRIHPNGECNQEMLEEMDNYLMVESDSDIDESTDSKDNEIDPRWADLKKLKKK